MQLLKMPLWEQAIRGLMAWICQLIYPLIGWLYDLFMNISKVDILSSDTIKPIYQRITLILTIVMVFYVTFEFVKFVVQPDGITDKEKGVGNIVYKMILVVVLIAFVPTIFAGAIKLQTAIVDKGVIGKVILGANQADPSKFGKTFSANAFSMFYSVEEELEEETCDGIKCKTLVSMNLGMLANEGKLTYLTKGLDSVKKTQTPANEKADKAIINFDGLFAVIFGGFVVYILAMYCIDVGARWAQLIFLQIIAPIPIIGYLSPKKDGIFQKWCKQCLTTYLDLFIRIAIIYFILLISSILLDERANPIGNGILSNVDPSMKTFVYIALILGVMMFAKKAPELLKELFPKTGAASGNFGLKAKDRGIDFKKTGRVLGRVAGAVGGAAIGAGAGLATGIGQGFKRSQALRKDGTRKGTWAGIGGATWGALRGTVGGVSRGIYQGSKKGNMFKNISAGYKNQVEANKKYGKRQENGYTLGHQLEDRARHLFGADSRVEAQESQKAPIKRQADVLKKADEAEKSIKKRALEKHADGSASDSKSTEVREASTRLTKAQTKVDELSDPNTGKEDFKVGKYNSSNAKQAQEEYENAVTLAKASVNKANFVDQTTGIFNEEAYNKAIKAAESSVRASDFSIAYSTQAEADAAYQAAVNAKKLAIKRSNYSTDDAYRTALVEAENSVNKEMYIQGYATQEDADAAHTAAKEKAIHERDEAEKAFVSSFVEQANDGVINTTLESLEQAVIEYNKTSSSERRVENVTAAGIKGAYGAFRDRIKKDDVPGSIRKVINSTQAEIDAVDAEIDRIKRETEGSGINEGKK